MSRLLDFLLENAENKGVMATLRRGLVASTELRAWPILAHFNGIGNGKAARAVRTVAGLFAYHPLKCDTGNLGNTCQKLCTEDEQPWKLAESDKKGITAVKPGPMSQKFAYLISADEEICERVKRIVLFAKSQNIPINYAQLEIDLATWPAARERWAASFWCEPKSEGNKKS